jgi:hypothetical protein
VTSSVIATKTTKPDTKYKKWGVDNTNEDEYWFDSRIHTLGNCGFMGAVSDKAKNGKKNFIPNSTLF